ncbi:uncharacterized protein LOC18448819 isoform X4 [Amborella trichopoda]|uniref:uncharacterized protein LOC18448819 isoform X4 n=1 Tax=Amborella trichopoda TaxID=13333 RepID=UPI0009BF5843|nr:uncharacterized protein LOC18448819 isoform X4 [Amborella trichopoda]|eukprot:XP_020532116.1 uncharacterized protein LOC18448819 isoform X4 [Amborella trichopoda]
MQSGRRRLLQHLLAAAPASALRPPWSALQNRGAKVLGTDVRLGNIIQRKGTKSTTYSAWKRWSNNTGVFVEDKSFQFLYQEGHSVTVMEPDTFEQMEVSKDLFGKRAAYLKDGMTVTVQLYDGKPMSASVPQRVTCTVVEAQTIAKGQTLTPQYKKVVLDNGLTVLAPAFIKTGDVIVVNTNDDSYMTRAKE